MGDRVYWSHNTGGTYKEMTLTNELTTFPLHPDLSFQQGAAIGVPYCTAYRALISKAKLAAGEKVLIHGASGAVSIDIFNKLLRKDAIICDVMYQLHTRLHAALFYLFSPLLCLQNMDS